MARNRTIPRTENGTFLLPPCAICGKVKESKYNCSNKFKKKARVCLSCSKTGRPCPKKTELSDKILDQYQNGESARSIASRLGLTPRTVIAAIKRAGHVTRCMSEAIKLLDNVHQLEGALNLLRESGELAKKMSAGMQKIPLSEWNGFRKEHWERIRNTKEWKIWRSEIFSRDKYKCVMCHSSSSTRTGNLHPHHIERKADHPEIMFSTENGVTLCGDCHKNIFRRESDFAKTFKAYIDSL